MLMLIAILCLPPTAETAVPVHSHNDYWRSRPLQEALEAGSMLVHRSRRGGPWRDAHGGARSGRSHPERTLTSMYLSPLAEIVRARQRVYPQDQAPLILLVDLEDQLVLQQAGNPKAVLEAYADILKAPAGHHQGDGGVLRWRSPVQASDHR